MSSQDQNFYTRYDKAMEAEKRFKKEYERRGWYIYEYGIHMGEKHKQKFKHLPDIIKKTPDFICWKPEARYRPIFVEHKMCGKDWFTLKEDGHMQYKRFNNLMPLIYAIEIYVQVNGLTKKVNVFCDWKGMDRIAQESLAANNYKMQPFPKNTYGAKEHYPIKSQTIKNLHI